VSTHDRKQGAGYDNDDRIIPYRAAETSVHGAVTQIRIRTFDMFTIYIGDRLGFISSIS
jgi:hypothetical protein